MLNKIFNTIVKTINYFTNNEVSKNYEFTKSWNVSCIMKKWNFKKRIYISRFSEKNTNHINLMKEKFDDEVNKIRYDKNIYIWIDNWLVKISNSNFNIDAHLLMNVNNRNDLMKNIKIFLDSLKENNSENIFVRSNLYIN